MVNKLCEWCNTPLKSTQRKFCSLSCSAKYGNSKRSYISHKVTKICTYCGELYTVKPCRSTITKFCSRDCHDKGKRPYKGIYYGYTWLRHNYKEPCVICGYDKMVHIHHIVSRKNNGDDSPLNLVCLCPNHHAEAHLGLINIDILKKNCIKYDGSMV